MFKYFNQIFKRPAWAKIGTIGKPSLLNKYTSSEGEGLFALLNNIMNLMIVGAGIFALFNFITAGYQFISASDNPDKINEAWNKIWQSMLGVLIAAGSYVLAGILGKLVFGDWTAIINPTITGPN